MVFKKSIIFLLLIFSLIFNINAIILDPGFGGAPSGSAVIDYGWDILTSNNPYKLVNITKFSNTGATICYVRTSSDTILYQANFSGNTCTLNYELNVSTPYKITLDNNGNSYAISGDAGTGTTPVTFSWPELNITSAEPEDGDNVFGIDNIGIININIESSTQPYYNLENITIYINTTNYVNLNYSLDGGAYTSLWLNQNNGSLNLTNLALGEHNITFIDNESNILTEYFEYQPFQYFYFQNITGGQITNFTVDDVLYEFFAKIPTSEIGLGTHTFTFRKSGFNLTEFQKEININSQFNETIGITFPYITINLKNVDDGNPAPINNYSIYITDLSDGSINNYEIVTNNTLQILNEFSIDTNVLIKVISNNTIANSLNLITSLTDVNITFYLPFETTTSRTIQVLTSSFIGIPQTDVYLYTFVSGEGFVLETIKETNDDGYVSFNIIENDKIYNICNTYNNNQKCLSSVTFENAETDPSQIVHDTSFSSDPPIRIADISWNPTENKTNVSSKMTMTFNDAQSLVTKFCYNVTRYTNNSITFNNEYCNENPNGQIVNTFSLLTNQKIDYDFYYYINSNQTYLTSYTTYGENAPLIAAKGELGLLDALFLFIYLGAIGVLLKPKNFTFYNIGILIVLAVVFSVQAYFNESYVVAGVWVFLALKTGTFYFTRGFK